MNGNSTMASVSILTPIEIEKIKSEEVLRKQIRDELSPSPQTQNNILKFLNSSFGLLVVSGILIAGIGKLFADQIETIKKGSETRREAIKYMAELDERIFRLEFFVAKLDTSISPEQKRYYSSGGIDGVKIGSTASGWYIPVFAEFGNVHTQALIHWLKINVKGVKGADEAIKSLQTLVPNDEGAHDVQKVRNVIEQVKDFELSVEQKLQD